MSTLPPLDGPRGPLSSLLSLRGPSEQLQLSVTATAREEPLQHLVSYDGSTQPPAASLAGPPPAPSPAASTPLLAVPPPFPSPMASTVSPAVPPPKGSTPPPGPTLPGPPSPGPVAATLPSGPRPVQSLPVFTTSASPATFQDAGGRWLSWAVVGSLLNSSATIFHVASQLCRRHCLQRGQLPELFLRQCCLSHGRPPELNCFGLLHCWPPGRPPVLFAGCVFLVLKCF